MLLGVVRFAERSESVKHRPVMEAPMMAILGGGDVMEVYPVRSMSQPYSDCQGAGDSIQPESSSVFSP